MSEDIKVKENSESDKSVEEETKIAEGVVAPSEESEVGKVAELPTENIEIEEKIDPNAVIDFIKVRKEYSGEVIAVNNITFKIGVGEFVSLVGPSGAGKSTLIRMLTREELPSSGQIYVAGRDITTLRPKELPYFRRKVGIIFQDFKLLPKKTVYENIAFALEVAGSSDSEIKDSVPKIIEIVGLTRRHKALSEELSGGEKQRVSIARALVHKPKILIADEPTGNLDPVTTWEIIELLFKINRQGTIVLLATHDKEVVDALQRRVITMRDGKIVGDAQHGKYIL